MKKSSTGSNIVTCALVTFVVVAWAVDSSADVVIDMVPVGNAGNMSDKRAAGGIGAVPYNYNIGKYEVTNAQHNECPAFRGHPRRHSDMRNVSPHISSTMPVIS